MRLVAWFLLVGSLLSVLAELCGGMLPTLSWAFDMSHDMRFLHHEYGEADKLKKIAWFGYLISLIKIGIAVFILASVPAGKKMLPTTKLRLQRFKGNTRGYVSFIIMVGLMLLAGLDQMVVGKRALYVSVEDKSYFPAFRRAMIPGEELGVTGDTASAETNYRKLKAEGKHTVIMPLVPFDPSQDTASVPFKQLSEKNGLLIGLDGQPMNGSVSTLYDNNSETRHMIYDYRKGKVHGLVIGRNLNGEPIYEAKYDQGSLITDSEKYSGKELSKDEFLAAGGKDLVKVLFHASPPSNVHLLGTTTEGNDLLAYLYGGLQVNIKAALVYIPAIYIIGVSLGLLMGFFGGVFDLVFQRIIEVFSTIPFLFVVIIFSKLVPTEFRGLMIILGILILFGWMGMTYLMRTAAMKEKARDYVAAARVSGASTPRIIFSHILPNTMAILVTLVPFSVSSIILALTSLDYLGFGLPPEYATWGTLLKEGLANFSKPWLVTSSFLCLVATLILVTFIGEAVRDAFDPKKFTTYK